MFTMGTKVATEVSVKVLSLMSTSQSETRRQNRKAREFMKKYVDVQFVMRISESLPIFFPEWGGSTFKLRDWEIQKQ